MEGDNMNFVTHRKTTKTWIENKGGTAGKMPHLFDTERHPPSVAVFSVEGEHLYTPFPYFANKNINVHTWLCLCFLVLRVEFSVGVEVCALMCTDQQMSPPAVQDGLSSGSGAEPPTPAGGGPSSRVGGVRLQVTAVECTVLLARLSSTAAGAECWFCLIQSAGYNRTIPTPALIQSPEPPSSSCYPPYDVISAGLHGNRAIFLQTGSACSHGGGAL
ncbi:hypothetical protein JZ751_016819 [Albula glossodonta]|uniref:Uncharacterized protein n=1 Tax=Albula glossodonta TaxID=121402 RepID=A0A8T2P0Z0_9TELE|nr:hypothetical protein JZ751_016819 [Albula glossodonta]